MVARLAGNRLDRDRAVVGCNAQVLPVDAGYFSYDPQLFLALDDVHQRLPLFLDCQAPSKYVWKRVDVAKLSHLGLAVRTNLNRISVNNGTHFPDHGAIVQFAFLNKVLWNLLLYIPEGVLHHLFHFLHHFVNVWEP